MINSRSPRKSRIRRRSATWRPSFPLGACVLLLVLAVSLFLLRREIEVLTDLNNDPDRDDWPTTHLQLRAADRAVEDKSKEGSPNWEQALEDIIKTLGDKEPQALPKRARPALSIEGQHPVLQGRQLYGNSSENPWHSVEEANAVRRREGGRVNDAEVGGGGDGRSGRRRQDSEAEESYGGDRNVVEEGEEVEVYDSTQLVRDVTLVISAKHRFSSIQEQLEAVLTHTPPVPILYVMSGPMSNSSRHYLTTKKKAVPHMELRDAGAFTSGYGIRNATVELLTTPYALFLFNDVLPANSRWLQELYAFAEAHPEGTSFSPFIWEKHSTGTPPLYDKGGEYQDRQTLPHMHPSFPRELAFDDFGNDGKLYLDRKEDDVLIRSSDPDSLPARETSFTIEDHCVLVRTEFLKEAVLWDPRAAFTRQDVELALTLRYWSKRSFFVPRSQVVYHHPSSGLLPSDLPLLATQSSEELCAGNLVHLRRKWGIVTGQLCRGFVDESLRGVVWGEGDLGRRVEDQTQLLLSMFILLGMNRFKVHSLPTWRPPPTATPVRCRSRDHASCPRVIPWMAAASDSSAMLAALGGLETALTTLGGGGWGVNETEGGPQMWIGRAELRMPLRINRVLDTWRAGALQSGQLFPVRKSSVRRRGNAQGKRAPELPILTRLYLPFMVVEMELLVPRSVGRGLEVTSGLSRVVGGLSLVLREPCLSTPTPTSPAGTPHHRGYLLSPGGRSCGRVGEHYRGFMYIRHLDREATPRVAFNKLKQNLLRGLPGGKGGWVEGKLLQKWLAPALQGAVRRIRVVSCIPGTAEACSMSLPLGSSPQAWQLVLWAWRPQSVRTAQVLLLNAEAVNGRSR